MGRRVIVIVLGAILFVGAAAVAIGGAALMIVFGSDGTASSGVESVGTQRVALVAAIDDIQDTNGFAAVLGRPTLHFHAASADQDVFVGIGPAASVERYLAGASIDRVTNFDVDPFRITTHARAGSTQPAPPADQTFWTASSSGTDANISWKVTDGSYRLVVMNADTTPKVAVDSEVALTVPHVFGIGLGVLIGGTVLAILGVVLIVVGARIRVRPRTATTAGGGVSVDQ